MGQSEDYLRELQALELTQGVEELRKLMIEFDSALARMPRLKQEIETMQTSPISNYEEVAKYVKKQLSKGADLMASLDNLPKTLQKTPTLKKLVTSMKQNITLDSVDSWAKKIKAVQISYPFVFTDETALDINTGLTWTRNANLGGERFSLIDAMVYVKKLCIGGFNDWRLPTHDELCVIYRYPSEYPDKEQNKYADYFMKKGFVNCKRGYLCCRTKTAANVAITALSIFNKLILTHDPEDYNYVWAVRCGQ